jgi:hypothetical protein
MAIVTAERLKEMLDNRPSVVELFIIRALEQLLGEEDFNTIIDELIPETVNGQTVLFGHKLGEYSGLDRETIKDKFTNTDGSPLDDDDVDDIFEALGVVESEGVMNPFGGDPEPLSEPEPAPVVKPGVITGDLAKNPVEKPATKKVKKDDK